MDLIYCEVKQINLIYVQIFALRHAKINTCQRSFLIIIQ